MGIYRFTKGIDIIHAMLCVLDEGFIYIYLCTYTYDIYIDLYSTPLGHRPMCIHVHNRYQIKYRTNNEMHTLMRNELQ